MCVVTHFYDAHYRNSFLAIVPASRQEFAGLSCGKFLTKNSLQDNTNKG